MTHQSVFSRLGALLAGGLVLAMFSIAHAAPLVIEHAQGSTTVPTLPQRVAVFDLGVLDTLMALEVKVAGIPQGSWPAYLQNYPEPGHVRVGTLFEPDYEALKKLQPDLIIIGRRTGPKYEELSAIAPTIDLNINAGKFVDGVRRNLTVLGRLFDRTEQAAQLDATLVNELAALQAAGARAGTGLTLFTINNNVIVHAPGERYGMLHELTGMDSTAPAAEPQTGSKRPAPGSPEAEALRVQRAQRLVQALAQEPDWLFVLDRGAATGGGKSTAAATLAQDERIVALPAWRNNRVYYLDPPTWYVATGGYIGLLHGIRDMRQALSAQH